MARYGFIINLDTCADHRGCMASCKAKTNSFLGSHYVEVHTSMSDAPFPEFNTYFIPLLCQHCASPSCVGACPEGVFSKREDGIVVVGDTSLCQGCADKPCIAACPYGCIDLDPVSGKVGKCDMCADLVDKGEQPACTRNCFTNSWFFGDFDDPSSIVSQILEQWTGYWHQLNPENGSSVYYLLSKREWQGEEGLYSPAWHNEW